MSSEASIWNLKKKTICFCRRLHYLQMNRAAISIQSWWRMCRVRSECRKRRRFVVQLQAQIRAYRVRLLIDKLRYQRKVVVIQKWVRMFLLRKKFSRQKSAAVTLQCWMRRIWAQRELKSLRIQAKSIDHVKNLNRGLEQKIMDLQRKVDELVKI